MVHRCHYWSLCIISAYTKQITTPVMYTMLKQNDARTHRIFFFIAKIYYLFLGFI